MRLVIVSNRLPFTVVNEEGGPQFKVSSGGLTTGLWSYLERGAAGSSERPEFVWLGWPGASVAPRARGGGPGLRGEGVQGPAGLPAGGEHGPLLPRVLQQDAVAAVPLLSLR